MSSDEQLRRIDALIGVSLRIARSAPSGRIALARLARAIDVDWIPRPWGDELAVELHASLQVVAAPLPVRTVERILRDAWGVKPDKELDSLEPEPVAVTPTSQVHRGVLDGEPVAVKVLRPGVVSSMRQDLTLLDAVLGPLGAAFPGIDARAVLREFRQRVLDELDLESEANAQRRFHRALRRHPLLRVPAPVMRLTHAQVMVSEWVEGVPLLQAPDRDRATAQLLLFHMGAAAVGLVHADPDPEDVRVQADGRIAILDFGCWAEVPAERVALARQMVDALHTRDPGQFAGALQHLGWLPVSAADLPISYQIFEARSEKRKQPQTLPMKADRGCLLSFFRRRGP